MFILFNQGINKCFLLLKFILIKGNMQKILINDRLMFQRRLLSLFYQFWSLMLMIWGLKCLSVGLNDRSVDFGIKAFEVLAFGGKQFRERLRSLGIHNWMIDEWIILCVIFILHFTCLINYQNPYNYNFWELAL